MTTSSSILPPTKGDARVGVKGSLASTGNKESKQPEIATNTLGKCTTLSVRTIPKLPN